MSAHRKSIGLSRSWTDRECYCSRQTSCTMLTRWSRRLSLSPSMSLLENSEATKATLWDRSLTVPSASRQLRRSSSIMYVKNSRQGDWAVSVANLLCTAGDRWLYTMHYAPTVFLWLQRRRRRVARLAPVTTSAYTLTNPTVRADYLAINVSNGYISRQLIVLVYK